MSLRTRRAAALLLAPAALAAAACGNDDSPDPWLGPGQGGTSGISRVASAYLDTAVGVTGELWYWAPSRDWARVRRDVGARVPDAETRRDTYTAIDWMVTNVLEPQPDLHSGFWRPENAPGRTDAPPSETWRRAQGRALALPTGGRQAAYLWIPTFTGTNPVGRADSIQQVIRTLDAQAPCGWIVDLRRNPGGYWAAMLAGLHPILGDARASATAPGVGGFIERDGARINYTMFNGGAGIYVPATSGQRDTTEIFTQVTNPYRVQRANLPVAILQGGRTASAGEIIVFAFRGTGIPTRSFGDSTFGVTTQPYGYTFSDGGYLQVTAAVMFDRTGQRYGWKIGADERIVSPDTIAAGALQPEPRADDPVVNAARRWLAGRAECTAGTAAEAPARSRAPLAPVVQPGEAKPIAVPLDRVSRYLGAPAGAR